MKTSRFFKIFKWFITKALKVYFSEIEIVNEEKVPKDEPFILACNHQNAFLDALIVGALIPRYLHFLTRSDVFTRKSEYLLKKLQMIPIYRIRDGFGELGKNQETFSQCTDIFKQNGSVMIFSEGNHGEHYYLRKLTKGTARIAFESISEMETDLKLVPCGLNFFSHGRARTKLIVVYGDPISVGNYRQQFEEDKQAALKQLTADLSEGMKKCLVIPENTPDYDMKVRRVFNIRNEGLSFKKLCEFADRDYSSDQARFIPPRKPNGTALWWASLPNWGPLWLLKNILAEFQDKVFWGSMKFAVMMILMPLWWVLSFGIGWLIFGFWEGVVLVFLSVLGLFIRAELLKSS